MNVVNWLFGWSNAPESQPEPLPHCDHEHWDVLGSNRIGYGTCSDCKREVYLDELFRALKAKLEREFRDGRCGCRSEGNELMVRE